MNKEEVIKQCKVFNGKDGPDAGKLSSFEYFTWYAEARYVSYVTKSWVGALHETEESMEECRANFIACGLEYSDKIPRDLEVMLFEMDCIGADTDCEEIAKYFHETLDDYIGLTSMNK